MYNPINMAIEDENRLKDKDAREKAKKERYQARYTAEETTRNECLAENERQDKMKLAKVSYNRVAEEVSRGYDIMTGGELRGGLAKISTTNWMQPKTKAWDMLSPGSQAAAIPGNSAAADTAGFEL